MYNTSPDYLTAVEKLNVSAMIKHVFTAKSQEDEFCDLLGQSRTCGIRGSYPSYLLCREVNFEGASRPLSPAKSGTATFEKSYRVPISFSFIKFSLLR